MGRAACRGMVPRFALRPECGNHRYPSIWSPPKPGDVAHLRARAAWFRRAVARGRRREWSGSHCFAEFSAVHSPSEGFFNRLTRGRRALRNLERRVFSRKRNGSRRRYGTASPSLASGLFRWGLSFRRSHYVSLDRSHGGRNRNVEIFLDALAYAPAHRLLILLRRGQK